MTRLLDLREVRWLTAAVGLVILFSSLPYFAGYKAETPDRFFNGAVFDRLDFSGYMATMQQAREGGWLYRYPFTSEPQAGAYVRMPYVALGHLAGWLGLSNIAVFHISRLLFAAVALVLVYRLTALCFQSVRLRRFAFLLAVFGSGLGWFQGITGQVPVPDVSPIDFWLIDAYVFFGLLSFPHFAAAIAGLVGMFLGFTLFSRGQGVRYLFAAVAGAVFLQFINPYWPLIADMAVLGSVIFAWAVNKKINRSHFIGLFVLAAGQLPLFVYNLIVFRTEPVFGGFAEQALTLSPPPVYYLWGFALFWPLAILGIYATLKGRLDPVWAGLITWLGAGVLLSVLPFVFQRRFLFAITIPLALVAGLGVQRVLLPWLRSSLHWAYRRRGLFSLVFLVFASLSSLYLVFGMVLFYLPSRPADLFDPAAAVRTLELLDELAEENDVVLSRADTGRIVAEKTGLTVYLGHPIETLNYTEKVDLVDRYFAGELGAAWVREQGVEWVFLRPSDGEIADPAAAGLQLVAEEEGARLFRVLP